MQDHFSKRVVAYVVKDQKARTAAEALRRRYLGLLRAPAYLLSDKGKSFTAMVVEDLCKLYSVKKLRTSHITLKPMHKWSIWTKHWSVG